MSPSQDLRRWATFVSLSLLFFLVNAGTFASLGVVLHAMVPEMGWTWSQAGLGYTVLGQSCGFACLLPPLLIRRVGVRSPLMIGTVLLVVGFSLLARGHSVATYLTATLMMGAGNALTATVPGTHVLTSLFRRRSAVLGAYFTAGALGAVVGPLLYVAVNSLTHGWRVYWVLFACGAAVFGLFAVLATPNRLDASTPETVDRLDATQLVEGLRQWTVRRALGAPQFYVIAGSYMLYLMINTTMHGFTVEHLSEHGIDPKAAAAMMSFEALVGAGISTAGGFLGEKVGAKRLLIAALVALGVGATALSEARGFGLMTVYALAQGTAFGLIYVAPAVLLLTYFGRGPYLELYSLMSLFSVLAAVGPTIAGRARDIFGDFSGVFQLFAAATLLMLAAAVTMKPPGGPAQPEPQAKSLAREAA